MDAGQKNPFSKIRIRVQITQMAARMYQTAIVGNGNIEVDYFTTVTISNTGGS